MLSEIALRLGMEEYPEVLDAYFPIPKEREKELCTEEMIRRLQKDLDLFGPYFDLVLQGFREILQNPDKKAYVDAAALHIRDTDVKGARRLRYPETDGTVGGNMLPLYAIIPSVEDAYKEYVDRGFDPEHAKVTLEGIKINLQVVEEHITGWPGLTYTYSNWLGLYIKCKIFYHGGLNYEVHTAPSYSPYILKNKTTGELLALYGNGTQLIHRNGLVLGSAGAMEEEGAFQPLLTETETEFTGHPCRNYRVQKERETYSKAEWEKVYGPGDMALSIHIPRKTDFSPESITKSLKEALELARKCYPECDFKLFFCASWLLSPLLNEVLGEESNISKFSSRFSRFIRKSPGTSPFGYVFPKKYESYETLPENTRLQRALKQKYIEGEFVYDTPGVILF